MEMSIYTETSENIGLLYNNYKNLPEVIDKFLYLISTKVKLLINDPGGEVIDISKDISRFKDDISIDDAPEPIDVHEIPTYRKDINKVRINIDNSLVMLSRLKNKIAFGGNFIRGILMKPKVYSRDIDEDKYNIINTNIRALNRALDWVEKIIIDLFNMVDQDRNILTIIEKLYVRNRIFENGSEDYINEEFREDVRKPNHAPGYLKKNHDLGYGEDRPIVLNPNFKHDRIQVDEPEKSNVKPTTSSDYNDIREVIKSDINSHYFRKWFAKVADNNGIDISNYDYSYFNNRPDKNDYTYGYFTGSKIDAIIKVFYTPNKNNQKIWRISKFWVNPLIQGKGIGSKLFSFIVDRFGTNDLFLQVHVNNAKAIHIYKKYGFKTLGKIDGEKGEKYYEMKRNKIQKNVVKESYDIEPFIESVDDISSPKELLKWMSKNLTYGFIGTDSKRYELKGNADENSKTFSTLYKLQTPAELAESNIGVCWDQTEFEREWFKKHSHGNQNFWVYHIRSKEIPAQPTHTFLLFKENEPGGRRQLSRFCWFENSWEEWRGIHKYTPDTTKAGIISNIGKKFMEYYKLKDSNKLHFYELKELPKFGCSYHEYMKYAITQKEINLFHISTEKMQESSDDEYVIETEYWNEHHDECRNYYEQIGNTDNQDGNWWYLLHKIKESGLDHYTSTKLTELESEFLYMEFHDDSPYFPLAQYRGFHEPDSLMKICNIYRSLYERSELKYVYRMGYDVKTGIKIAIQFDINPDKITSVGDQKLTATTAPVDNVEDIHRNAISKVKGFVKKYGHIDHSTGGLKVSAIFDYTNRNNKNKSYWEITILPAYSNILLTIISEICNKYRRLIDVRPEDSITKSSYKLHKFMETPAFKTALIECIKNNWDNCTDTIESYHISKDDNDLQGENKYKTTKLFWNYDNVTTFRFTPQFRGPITPSTRNKNFDNSDTLKQLKNDYDITNKPRKGSIGESMDDLFDNLDWIESYLLEAGEDDPPSIEEPKSLPKQRDSEESNKNGVRRKKLYIAFIEWCKDYNPKNTFGSVFDKEVFHSTYPFVPPEMRYFYRLANPMLCVLGGGLTFFAVAELRKLNSKNSRLSEMMIFAATDNDLRVFNNKDKKVYHATTENGMLKLGQILGETFDTYIQNMIGKGDILNAPMEDDTTLTV